jgi:hypothetical protein
VAKISRALDAGGIEDSDQIRRHLLNRLDLDARGTTRSALIKRENSEMFC